MDLISASSEDAFTKFLTCVKVALGDTLTRLHTVVVDKCDAERNSIKAVFAMMRVRLCYWHQMYADAVARITVSLSMATWIVGFRRSRINASVYVKLY